MKLHETTTSPCCRKARLVCLDAGLDDRVQLVPQMLRDNVSGVHSFAPLARISVSETDDGQFFVDTRVIREHLDQMGNARLFPKEVASRQQALNAIGDRLLDTLTPLRHELLRPSETQSSELNDRSRATVERLLDRLETGPVISSDHITIGDVSIARAALSRWLQIFARSLLVLTHLQNWRCTNS